MKTVTKAPLWGTLLQNQLKNLAKKRSVRPIDSLIKSPACQINPFQEKLVHHYGMRMVKGDAAGAGAFVLRFAAYQRCISRAGMRDWDEALARYYKELFKKDVQTIKDGVKATFNIALMIFDHLDYTGFSQTQATIKNNLSKFQEALVGESTDALFCSDYQVGAVLQFSSPAGSVRGILGRAANMVANRNGELGLGQCSLCEMASANFAGFCDRGKELLDCINRAGGTLSTGGKTDPSALPGGGSGADSSSGGKGGSLDRQALNDYLTGHSSNMPDPLNGMTEGQLRLTECGLGSPGALSGLIGNMPKGHCSMADIISAVPHDAGPFAGNDPYSQLANCAYKNIPRHGLLAIDAGMNTEMPNSNNPSGGNCAISQGNGKVDVDNVSYLTSVEATLHTSGGDRVVHVDFAVRVDSQNDYSITTSASMTNPQTGSQTPIDPAALDRGEIVPQRDPQSTTTSGNLGDRNADSRTANTLMNQARDQGHVTPASCIGAGCSPSNASQANANEAARGDEQRRQRANSGDGSTTPKPKSGGAGDPGPEGADTCTAEGRRAQAIMDCAEGAQAATDAERTGPLGGDGKPLGPVINPGEEGGGSAGIQIPDCLVPPSDRGETKNVYNGAAGATDSCMFGDDPSCASGGQGGEPTYNNYNRAAGWTDPGEVQPVSNGGSNPCPSIPGLGGNSGDSGCPAPEGGGGGDTDRNNAR